MIQISISVGLNKNLFSIKIQFSVFLMSRAIMITYLIKTINFAYSNIIYQKKIARDLILTNLHFSVGLIQLNIAFKNFYHSFTNKCGSEYYSFYEESDFFFSELIIWNRPFQVFLIDDLKTLWKDLLHQFRNLFEVEF